METTTSLVPTSDAATEPVLLKTDVLGRVKHTREQRERILDEFERSGASGCQFAALVGVRCCGFFSRRTFGQILAVRFFGVMAWRGGGQSIRLNARNIFRVFRGRFGSAAVSRTA